MAKIRTWKKISGKIAYQNPWIKIHEDKVLRPDGSIGMYGYLEKPVGVFIVAHNEHKNTILFIKQYRYPLRKSILELPAGVSQTKNYQQEAKRELKEETGITGGKWKHLGGFYLAPGHESTRVETYLVTGFKDGNLHHNGQEGDESISEIVEVNIDKLPELTRKGKIDCGISIAALNLFFQYRNK